MNISLASNCPAAALCHYRPAASVLFICCFPEINRSVSVSCRHFCRHSLKTHAAFQDLRKKKSGLFLLCTSTNEISKGILNSLSCTKQFLRYQRLPITQIIKFSLTLERQRFTADWKDLKEGGGAETSLESAFKHGNTVSYRRLNCKRTMKHTQPVM